MTNRGVSIETYGSGGLIGRGVSGWLLLREICICSKQPKVFKLESIPHRYFLTDDTRPRIPELDYKHNNRLDKQSKELKLQPTEHNDIQSCFTKE